MNFEINPGIIISKLDLKENDTIIITIDPELIDLNNAYEYVKCIQQIFYNNIIVKFKGIDIEVKNNDENYREMIDEEWDRRPITYYTKGKVTYEKYDEELFIYIDDILVLRIVCASEPQRGLRSCLGIYDDAVPKDIVNNVIIPICSRTIEHTPWRGPGLD